MLVRVHNRTCDFCSGEIAKQIKTKTSALSALKVNTKCTNMCCQIGLVLFFWKKNEFANTLI